MNLQNIVKIVCGVFGFLGVILLFRIITTGDEEIKMAAAMGDFGTVSPLVSLSLFIVGIIVVVTLVFSLANLASDAQKLKKALIFIGLFGLVVALSFGLSSGVETPLKDGEVLSASGSRWVEAGLRTFFILTFVAVGAMLYSGVQKLINR